MEPLTYQVSPPQQLRAYRYPGLRQDCEALAASYLDFAKIHLMKEAF